MPTVMYTVKPGDTLWSIGRSYGIPIDVIVRDNGLQNANDLSVGQQLKLTTSECPNWYVVKSGDSLWAIANRFFTTLDDLMRLNELASPNVIFPGQIIRIR
jgi:lysozyme